MKTEKKKDNNENLMFLRIQAAKKEEVIQLKKVCWGGGGLTA